MKKVVGAKSKKDLKKIKKAKIVSSWNFKKIANILADSPLPEILFVTSIILARWWLNSDFSYPVELIMPILIFSILASGIFYLYRKILGKGSAAHLAAILLTYSLYAYSYVHGSKIVSGFLDIIPSNLKTEFTESVVLATTLFILAGAVAWGIRKFLNQYPALRGFQPYKVLLFALVFMFATQVYRSGARYLEIHKGLSYSYPAPNLSKPANSPAEKPDIYYLLFDRYTSADTLKSNFKYDNSDLMNFLKDNDFVTRDGAYSNYPFTTPSVSSTMSMNYLPEFKDMFDSGKDGNWDNLFPYRSILNNPPVAQILKQNDYKYNQVSSWWDFTRLRVKADSDPTKSFRINFFGAKFYLSDVQRDIIHKSIFSPWLKKGVTIGDAKIVKYDLDRSPAENFNSQIDALKTIAASGDKAQPNFTFAHILAPHPPYVFNEDGSAPSYDNEANDNGVPERTKYTNEITYINKRIKETLTYIKTQSPNAVIVLQADEGPYPEQFRGAMTPYNYYDPANLPLDQMKQKFGILASYYMPGVDKEELKNLDASVNSFRFVLNKYLGYDLPMLPNCQIAMGNKFRPYKYELMTGKLNEQSDPAECQQYL